MAVLKPQYSAQSSDIADAGLPTLANGATSTSAAVDNSSNRYQDFLVEFYIAGTAAANAFLEVRALASQDGTNFGTWESGVPLGIIDLSVSPQRVHFSLVGHGGFFQVPAYFKIAVKNNTGAALSAGTIKWVGVNVEMV